MVVDVVTELSSRINLSHAINCEALCVTTLVTLPPEFRGNGTLVVHRAVNMVQGVSGARTVDIRLPGKGNSNSHGARTVHQKHRWIRTSRLPIKNSLFVHLIVREEDAEVEKYPLGLGVGARGYGLGRRVRGSGCRVEG